jgi:CDP-glycerol glycerophosphotransferase (TagB/SpsB family)
MCPFYNPQMGVVAIAKRLGIPVLAFITSFDNVTTKNRLLFDYDAYFVWSEQMKSELMHFYPRSRKRPIHVVGAPQFDVFRQMEFHQSRQEFCQGQGLSHARPIVVYGLGSPNLIREEHGVISFLEELRGRAKRPDIQLVLRLHPGFVNKGYRLLEAIHKKHPDVVIQGRDHVWKRIAYQGRDAIFEWVNTMRHADVLVNLSSTLSVDAAIFDRPVVNLNFDPEPGQPNQKLVKEINSKWHHFKPIAESGALWMVDTMDEAVSATLTYLEKPELHREKRRWLVEFVCHKVDGQCGARLAEALEKVVFGEIGKNADRSFERLAAHS